jgi:catechol 2,3-dioxygenase-like lactoylglutathione lyase family enzyme
MMRKPEQAGPPGGTSVPPTIEGIDAVSLATHDMARAVRFYCALGFTIRYGGEQSPFTSLHAGSGSLNLIAQPADRRWSWWGRVIFHVSDVDAFHARAVAAGLKPDSAPSDAPWGERFFHLTDPDGHELSFAKPLSGVGMPRVGVER